MLFGRFSNLPTARRAHPRAPYTDIQRLREPERRVRRAGRGLGR